MIKNVLLVDDDHEMLLALREGFEKYRDSFSVLLAHDGLGAVESLKNHVISLVITDLKMPRMDGFELLAQIMQYYPGIPVIIITAVDDSFRIFLDELKEFGPPEGIFNKPIDPQELLKVVAAILSD